MSNELSLTVVITPVVDDTARFPPQFVNDGSEADLMLVGTLLLLLAPG